APTPDFPFFENAINAASKYNQKEGRSTWNNKMISSPLPPWTGQSSKGQIRPSRLWSQEKNCSTWNNGTKTDLLEPNYTFAGYKSKFSIGRAGPRACSSLARAGTGACPLYVVPSFDS
ncbi:MAG: hypothetical protein ACLFPR_12695, partial [Desulfococcaceae bacterium]